MAPAGSWLNKIEITKTNKFIIPFLIIGNLVISLFKTFYSVRVAPSPFEVNSNGQALHQPTNLFNTCHSPDNCLRDLPIFLRAIFLSMPLNMGATLAY